MRGPPPAWQPPRPPQQAPPSQDYESNYEDPEAIHKSLMKEQDAPRDIFGNVLQTNFNSYEMSLSQQRRSNAMASATAPALDDSWDDKQQVLHKNADGAYYIPGSVRTATSTLSPASNTRFPEQCMPLMTSVGTMGTRGSEPTTALLKYNSATSIPPKKRKSKSQMAEKQCLKEDDSYDGHTCFPMKWHRCTFLFAFLSFLLLIAVIILLLRGPAYVYSEPVPSSGHGITAEVDRSSLRPLPSMLSLGKPIEADIVPRHMATTEFFVSRASRIAFNVTVGSGAQLVLLLRHSVPPSLSLHDFFDPVRADRIVTPTTQLHKIEDAGRRRRRDVVEMLNPRTANIEHFLMDGRWHLTVINERNRVEPIRLLAYVVPPPETKSSESNVPVLLRCENDCSGHGECVQGKCHCASGYSGGACEEPVCPVICSGNGVFSGGSCVCYTGFKGKECDVRMNWCEVPDCNGRGRCGDDGVCRCERGWEGEACETRSCVVPNCNEHGVCLNGLCYCATGWSGVDCSLPFDVMTLMEPTVAEPVYRSKDVVVEVAQPRTAYRDYQEHQNKNTAAAAKPQPPTAESVAIRTTRPPKTRDPVVVHQKTKTEEVQRSQPSAPAPARSCSGHGRSVGERCLCESGWSGNNCEQKDCTSCMHGSCANGVCVCDGDWHGMSCEKRKCAIGCEEHGKCMNDGTCKCEKGRSGENCYIDSCPRDCSGHGECVENTSTGDWHCQCTPSFTGMDCAVQLETECDDGLDNDGDGLVDCDDPECCGSSECQRESVCTTVPTPTDVLLRLPSVRNPDFFLKTSFLIKNDSVQSYSDHSQFNSSLASVIRGKVQWDGGSNSDSTTKVPLPGVRVSDALNPLYGFTLSRSDGEFDLLVNGGRTVNLQFLKSPFQKQTVALHASPHEIHYVTVVLSRNRATPPLSARPKCVLSSRSVQNPTIRSSWQLGTEGLPPGTKATLMADTKTVSESFQLPGSSTYLVYDSSRLLSSSSYLVMGLLGNDVDPELRLVHLEISIAGRQFTETLYPRKNLTHLWTWDKHNAYKQKEHGLVPVKVRIGYEYACCARDSEISWIERSEYVEGANVRSLEGNAWSLNVHHHLDIVNNVLEMGNGGRRFLEKRAPLVETVIGRSAKRELTCTNCNGNVDDALLYSPSALAYGLDGSLFVGDHNLIRRIAPNGKISTILSLSARDTTHSYYLDVNPLDGSLYISIPLQKQIWRISSFEPQNPESNHEAIAGDGVACASASDSCGDGGPATDAQLFYPKGIAFDSKGNLYVADGRKLRFIELSGSGTIRSLGEVSSDKPPSCNQGLMRLANLQFDWPTAVSVQKTTGKVFVLDSNIVYEIDANDDTARSVVGSLSTCPLSTAQVRHAKDIAAARDGSLYILESDGKKVNHLRRLAPDGTLSLFAGQLQSSVCSCDAPSCDCDDPDNLGSQLLTTKTTLFNGPSAVVVGSDGTVFLADTNNNKVKRIVPHRAKYNELIRQYTVIDPYRNELYLFNRNGLHMSTQSLITGSVLYNFTYNVETSLGKLSAIHGSGGLLLRVLRTNDTQAVIETPSGERTYLEINQFDGNIDSISTFGYHDVRFLYSSNGLLIGKSTSESATTYVYDNFGRAVGLFKDGLEMRVEPEKVEGSRVVTSVLKNGKPYFTFAGKELDSAIEGNYASQIINMNDGFSVTRSGVQALLDYQTHPAHGESLITKMKTTFEAPQNSSRRALTTRFDWRPYTKRDSNRRLAEVGSRPRVNGVNSYSLEYDRSLSSDTIRWKGEEHLMRVLYADNGEVREVEQMGSTDSEYKLANLTFVYDSLGRRNELRWGNATIQCTYDRQNRIVERVVEGGVSLKFGYGASGQHPTTIEYTDGAKFTAKYDAKHRLSLIQTPSEETHHFSIVAMGSEVLSKRRYPFTTKPFLLLENESGELLEWTTADQQHRVVAVRDPMDRVVEVLNDAETSKYSYDSAGSLSSITTEVLKTTLAWQGSLPISETTQKNSNGKWTESSFFFEYDDVLRPNFVQAVVEGTAVEPLSMSYDEKTGLLSSMTGYDILREPRVQRIKGHKMTHETLYDAQGQPSLCKVMISGGVVVQLQIHRDASGRALSREWLTPSGHIRERKTLDAAGKLTNFVRNDERWMLTHNKDGRVVTVNEANIEWHAGGVIKKFGTTEYTVDGNGWITKIDDAWLNMDGYGRLRSIRRGAQLTTISYDHLDRVININTGKANYGIAYGLPTLRHAVTHFSAGSSISSILYSEDGAPFAMTRDGYRYAVMADDEGTMRMLLSENGITKIAHRSPFGQVVTDSEPSIWTPLGYRGGIDIPGFNTSIIGGRAFDLLSGRFMSFGPEQLKKLSFTDIRSSIDLFAAPEENQLSSSVIPSEPSTLFRLSGLSPALLPSAALHLPRPRLVSARTLESFPQLLHIFGNPFSVHPSALVDPSLSLMEPSSEVAWSVEDSKLTKLFVITPNATATSVHFLHNVSKVEQDAVATVLDKAKQIAWPFSSGTRERHFVRSDSVPSSLSSSSYPKFLLVVSRDTVEMRSEKDKIVVHFNADENSVRQQLSDELRKKEAGALWRVERKRLERGQQSHVWTEREKRELLAKGAVHGYSIQYVDDRRSRLPSTYSWKFVKA